MVRTLGDTEEVQGCVCLPDALFALDSLNPELIISTWAVGEYRGDLVLKQLQLACVQRRRSQPLLALVIPKELEQAAVAAICIQSEVPARIVTCDEHLVSNLRAIIEEARTIEV